METEKHHVAEAVKDVNIRRNAKNKRNESVNMANLTGSLEDYIEMIYILQQKNEKVMITDISNSLKLTKPSVNKAVNNLKSEGLLTHERYGNIVLTERGEEVAKSVYDRHKVLTSFFIEVLHINPETAEEDACKVEHILSGESMEKLTKYFSRLMKG